MVHFQVEMREEQALALAQFLKRVGWSEWRANAVDDAEAALMRDGCEKVAASLAEVGYAPR